MKSNKEIREFCKGKCSHKECGGESLRTAKRERTFMGRTITPKGSLYCTYHNKKK